MAECARDSGRGATPHRSVERHNQALRLLDPNVPSPLQADILRWQGTVLRDRGRASEAEPLYARSLEIAKSLGYEAGSAHALNCLAALAQRRGDLAMAADMLTRAAAGAERCGERRLTTMIEANRGIIEDIRGDCAAALKHYRLALRSAEATRDDQQTLLILVNYSYLLVRRAMYCDAERALTRGLALAKSRQDLLSEGHLEENCAELRLSRGDIDEAYPSILRALEIAEQRRDDVRRAAALKLKGAYERLSGRAHEAASTLRYGLTLAAVGEDALLGGEILYQFGLALHDDQDVIIAREVWRVALDAFERIAAREWAERVRARLSTGSIARYV